MTREEIQAEIDLLDERRRELREQWHVTPVECWIVRGCEVVHGSYTSYDDYEDEVSILFKGDDDIKLKYASVFTNYKGAVSYALLQAKRTLKLLPDYDHVVRQRQEAEALIKKLEGELE